jgi:hypothetical protein
MQRREHEVAGVRGLERGVQCFDVPDLADQNHIRILSEHMPQRRPEGERIVADLALRDVRLDIAVQELDGVFDRDHVYPAILVHVIDHRRKRGGFTRAGDARDQHQTTGTEGNLLEHGW